MPDLFPPNRGLFSTVWGAAVGLRKYFVAPAGIITLFSEDQNFCGFCGTKKLVAQTQTDCGT